MSPCNNSDHCQKEDSLNRADGSELLRRQFDGQITSIQQSNSNSFPSRAFIWAMGSWSLRDPTRIPSPAVDSKSNQIVVGYPVTNTGLILSSCYCCTHGSTCVMGAVVTLIVDGNLPSSLQSIFRYWELTSREQVPSLVLVWFLCVVTKVCSAHRNRFRWATNSKQQLVGFFSLKLSLLCFQELHIFKKVVLKKTVDSYLFSNFLVALFFGNSHLKNCFKGSVDSF